MREISLNDAIAPTVINLRRLLVLRSIGIGYLVLAVGLLLHVFDIRLPLLPLNLILIFLVAWNVFTWRYLRRSRPVSQPVFFLHLAVDIAALVGVLYLSGGATNPFSWLLLLPLVIAATVLSKKYVWLTTALVVLGYSLLMRYYIPFGAVETGHSGSFKQHVIGMWFGFLLSSGIVAFFVAGMAKTLRERERFLSQAREQALRDKQLIALGTLAAGAAHELGTPLGTIAIIAKELQHECSKNENVKKQFKDLKDKADVINSQIIRCKEALSVISASAGDARADSGQLMDAGRYFKDMFENWHSRRKDIDFSYYIEATDSVLQIFSDRTLEQAMVNILDNAADVSPQAVFAEVTWTADEIIVDIRDRGPGLSKSVSAKLGKTQYTNKPHGLGLGLFLAHAAIERLGGHVTLYEREGGGISTRVSMPLSVFPNIKNRS